VGEVAYRLPGDLLEVPRPFSPRPLADAMRARPRAVLVSHEILPEEVYCQFDRVGASTIQAVPAAWAEAVCPRLAHHPSIVAYTAAAADIAALPIDRRSTLPGGRVWIA